MLSVALITFLLGTGAGLFLLGLAAFIELFRPRR